MVGKRNTAERYQIKMTSIDETTVFIDGTHIKANANNYKYKNEVIEKSVKFY
ncbi:TPA: hypothetical protein LA742_003583 [Clostridium botulinum]|uniref:hypothetical protein n=1 Tax=Clostridium sporogenes TaxID=1509 RepID=UPI0007741AD8|nr:hypothetical protein [Clostridium sporogenes]HBJ2615075.1 hypothetical protein [Clostridium botulinum]